MKRVLLSFLILSLVCITINGQPEKIEEKVAGMQKLEGFFTFYLDNNQGKVWLEVDRFDTEFLYVSSITAGLGSNDVGLDRNRLGGTKILSFKRVGPKVLMIQPNYNFRAVSDNPDEVKAVTDAFATSVIWSFKVEAESSGKVLVDITSFIIKDLNNIPGTMRRSAQGSYRQDLDRSSLYFENIKNFPLNSEFEAIVTFTTDSPGNFVRSVSPDGQYVSMRQHHSFISLPDDNYKPRIYDVRSSYGSGSYMDFAAPVDQSITKQFIRRHRLEKKDSEAMVSEAVEPIIYYVDRGAPEPIRTALVVGAEWWNQAFEASGYKDAFQVKILPEGADPMDIRYNMINWIHRSTRGWSYGSSVTDPRTGEIIKGHIALGSQRIRQDFLIASGLVAEYEEGKDLDPQIIEMALQRIRQLSCHEVGHTLGLAHNYAASITGRASVMDYPHPLVKINNGALDLSDAYPSGIGEWDKVAIEYGYQDFPDGTEENKELRKILDEAFDGGLLYLTDQDSRGGSHPLTHVWDNGKHPVDELERVMEIREIALNNFSVNKVPVGSPLSTLEEILVPVYLFHRYQIEASTTVLGGLYYNHNVRAGVQPLPKFVPAKEQKRALKVLLETIEPRNLALNEELLEIIPPRSPGYRQTRELFPGYTGLVFDPLGAAENIAEITLSGLFNPERAARLVLFHSRDKSLPGLDEIIDEIIESTWHSKYKDEKFAEIQRSVNIIVLNKIILLAANNNNAPQVRAIADLKIGDLRDRLIINIDKENNPGLLAHYKFGLKQIDFYIENPDKIIIPQAIPVPAGAPIGIYY